MYTAVPKTSLLLTFSRGFAIDPVVQIILMYHTESGSKVKLISFQTLNAQIYNHDVT
jgi:hypothetical protein